MSSHGFLTKYADADGMVYELSATLHVGEHMHHYSTGPMAVESLIRLALAAKLTHLWIAPEYTRADQTEQHARAVPVNSSAKEIQNLYQWEGYADKVTGQLASVVGSRKDQAEREVTIIWVSRTAWKYESLSQFATMIETVEQELGVSLGANAGITGLAYLRKVDEKNYFRYFELPKNIEWPMIRSVSVASIAHFPPLARTDKRLQKKRLYCFDRNSSQPYAAGQIKAGIGQPVPCQGLEFDHLVPGFWCVDIQGLEQIWQGLPLLPAHREWLPTPLVKMAASKGCKITVHEAYIWPDKKDRAPVFARWAKDLWALRSKYAPGTAERAAIKSIMNTTIGLLRRKNGEGFRDYRPDWYSLILAEERSVVWWKAHQVYEQTRIEPIAGYHDALYYCLDDESEIDLLTTRKDKEGNTHSTKDSLGGYKVDWWLPMDNRVIDILTAPEPRSAADRIGLLKVWGREHGRIC